MRPEEWRIMKDILEGVMSWAGMMRSPSFSREGESSTIMKLPERKEEMQEEIVSKDRVGGVPLVVVGLGDMVVGSLLAVI